MRTYSLGDFDFALPPDLIAQHPAPQRSASRLLDGRHSPPADRVFRELPALLSPGDLLVFNDTEVVKARLFGEKPTGGRLELLVERVLAILADRRLFDGRDVALDIGANIGTQSVYFGLSRRFARVLAVEPAPGNLELLELNVRQNGFSGLVTIVAAAAGDSDGTMTLHLDRDNHGANSLVNARSSVASTDVAVRRIDGLHQIIDGGDLERGHSETVERSHEHHGRGKLRRRDLARDVDPVETRHGDVEKQEVGRKRLRQVDRRLAVACRTDKLRPIRPREQELEPLGGERFVICDEDPKRLVLGHASPRAL